jgi:NADPH-dependent curcumin reductase CurA
VAGNREIRLAARPVGEPKDSDFELAETAIPEPGESQVLVRNVYLSVDPYMRGRMTERRSYVPSFQVGEPMQGGAVGQVIRSNSPALAVGDWVNSMLGWREYYVADGGTLMKIDPHLAPVSSALGVLGLTGFTAYVGLLDLGKPKQGETVFVSAASGAVGSVVGQIAKLKGCRVVGSAGSAEKVEWVRDELGFDEVFNYREENIRQALDRTCPDGIDINFENVGGEQMEAVFERMKLFGRVVLCGMISHYNDTELPRGPSLAPALVNRLTIRGFIISDHFDRLPDFLGDMGGWLAEGKVKDRETIVEGIENAPAAFIGLLRGENLGKMLVKVGPDPRRDDQAPVDVAA